MLFLRQSKPTRCNHLSFGFFGLHSQPELCYIKGKPKLIVAERSAFREFVMFLRQGKSTRTCTFYEIIPFVTSLMVIHTSRSPQYLKKTWTARKLHILPNHSIWISLDIESLGYIHTSRSLLYLKTSQINQASQIISLKRQFKPTRISTFCVIIPFWGSWVSIQTTQIAKALHLWRNYSI